MRTTRLEAEYEHHYCNTPLTFMPVRVGLHLEEQLHYLGLGAGGCEQQRRPALPDSMHEINSIKWLKVVNRRLAKMKAVFTNLVSL